MNPFEFHTGNMYLEKGDQFLGDCPFCLKEAHFYFNKDNLWDCKVCGKSGNLFTFLKELLEQSTQQEVLKLAEIKKLPIRSLKNLNVKYNRLNGSFLIPTYREGKLNNVYKYLTESNRIMATPGLGHSLFNYPEAVEDEVWIVEGHWDKVAGDAIVGSTRPITVCAVPGANTFKSAWCSVFRDKKVVLIFDNDKAGEAGRNKILEKIIPETPQKPREIAYVDLSQKSSGYDLRDCYVEYGRKAFGFIEDHKVPYTPPEGVVVTKNEIETIVEDMSCDSFDKLLDVFGDVYHITSDMKSALLLTLCSIYSVKVEGEQLWFRMIGPPGCGKTTIAKAVSASDQVVLKSTFTGLFSGWRDDEESDPGLIPIISGRSLIVKDADALLRQPNIEQIFAELRDFYDKDSSTSYRNRVARDYRNIKSTMILCGTHALRKSDNTFLGERFLDCEMTVTREDEEAIYLKAMEKNINIALDPTHTSPETKVQASTKGFITHLMDRNIDFTLPKELQREIIEIGKLVAKLRTEVERDRRGEISFKPKEELATRIIGQLVKVAFCCPVVLGTKGPNDETRNLIHKAARDILDPTSNRFKICDLLLEQDNLTRDELANYCDISRTQCTRTLDDLRALKFIEIDKRAGTGPGRKIFTFSLKEEIKQGLLRI